jgi:uncharacterized protein YegJ (DUF2314 family)
MRKLRLVTLVVIILLTACNALPAGEQDNVMDVSADDAAMNAAIERAQETLPLFIEALQSPPSTATLFSIKVRYPYGTSGAAEHLWVNDPLYQDGQFSGILANEPLYIAGLDLGDEVTVDAADITDWMIVNGDRMYGGFTIYVLRAKMNEDERSDFDAESGLTFADEPLLP